MKEYKFADVSYECGDGWLPIIEELFDKIQVLVDNDPAYFEFMVLQVKEKFGGLRVYTTGYDEKIDKLIDEAECKCLLTCENCGQPGHMTYRGTWMQTLCDKCYEMVTN